METRLLVLLVLCGAAFAGPLNSRWSSEETNSDNSECALECSGNNDKFRYNPDTTYVYRYEVNTETLMAGASDESATLNILAHAEIQVINGCEFSLRLKSTQVTYFDPYQREKKTDRNSDIPDVLQRNLLRFSFDNGIIKHICPDSNEGIWVLNFKRGLLSAFQNSMNNFNENQKVSEIDVTGHCQEVEYNISKEWSWKQDTIDVTKSKNLLSCSKRDGFKSFIQMVPYTIPSEVQSLPIIKSTHTCEQKISSDRILQSSSCKESHVYVPFSNQQSGGRTDVTQKLTYMTTKDSIDIMQGRIYGRHSLLFQHTNNDEQTFGGQESAEQRLKEICEQTTYDIRPETPRLFAELVQIIKTLDEYDLSTVYQKLRRQTICPQNPKAKKFFLDALPVAGTPGTVSMMLNIIKDDEVNEVEKEAWLLSLSLINNPTDEMIPLTLKLLEEPLTLQALLPVSALVNNYCQRNADCGDNYYISQLIDILDEKINYYCSVDDKNIQMVLRTLRAIGNIGSSRKFIPTINRCILSKYAPIEVKISAIEAYRRIPCPDETIESDRTLINLLQDKSEEPELRIAAYQRLMRCPTENTLQLVTRQLEEEESDEVGEYIYSHLNNLKKTSDPHKEELANAVKRLTLTKKFEANMLRSSRNFESSILLNKFNLGYAADGDLIWTKSSLMPRAVKANLTLELFGNSINLFDFGSRMEGIEYLITNLLGENKYIAKQDKPWSAEDLRLCLYGRIFGNELLYQHIEGDKDLPLSNLKNWQLPELLIGWSKAIDYEFSRSLQLFHGSWILPTVAGLSLNITVNSSASVHLGVKANVKINKILTRQRSFDISIDSIASGGLEVTGSMIVDANTKKMGLRMRNTLHSALPFKAKTSLSNAEGFSIDIDTPDDQINLFEFKSQFYIINDGFEAEIDLITENRQEFMKCSGSTLGKITGLELCGDIRYANASLKADAPYFPLTGPTSVSLVLNKKDTHSGYKVFAKWDKKRDHRIIQLSLNTPGSRVNRLISADVDLGYQKNKHVDIILNSPWTNMNLNGKLINDENVKRMVGNVRVDDEEYGLTTELTRGGSKKGMEFLPLVELIYKGTTKRLLSGQITMSQWKNKSPKDLSLSLVLNGWEKPLCDIKGDLVNKEKEKRVSLEVNPAGKSSYKFTAGSKISMSSKSLTLVPDIVVKSQNKNLLSLSGRADYRVNKLVKGYTNIRVMSMKPIKLSTELKKIGDKKKGKMSLKAKATVKSEPVNVAFKGDLIQSKNLIHTLFKAYYNIDNFGADNITLIGKVSDKSKNLYKQYKISSKLSFKKNPDYNLNADIDIHQKKETRMNMTVAYGKNLKNKNSQAIFFIQFPNEIPNLRNAKLDGAIVASLPAKKWNLEARLDHAHDRAKLNSALVFHFLPFIEDSAITAVSRLNPKDFSLTGSYSIKNKQLYSLDLISKVKSWNAGRWSVGAKTPERNIEAKANFRNEKERITAGATVNWDAEKSKSDSTEISVSGSLRNTQIRKSKTKLMKGLLELKTPFENFENINFRMNVDQKPKQLKSDGKLSWGGKSKQINLDLVTSLPITLKQVKLELAVKSPFKGYRQFEVDVDHVLNADVKTLLRGKVNNDESELKIKGTTDLNRNARELSGEISLKTPFRKYRDVQLTLNHKDDYRDYKSTAGFVHNSKSYLVDIVMTHNSDRWDAVNTGQLVLTSPDESVVTTWSHHTENEMKKIASKLRSTSNNKELINLKLSGSYEDITSAQLELDIDTSAKWKALRKIGVQLNHNLRDNSIICSGVVTSNRQKTGFDLNLSNENDIKDVNLVLFLNPLYRHDISLVSNVKYSFYPLTVSTQLEWAPRTKITLDGSLNAPSVDNFDLSSKLTTPFDDYENIHVKSSIKREMSELITHLNIDYAIKKMVDIETRYRNDENTKVVSVKFTSPSKHIESLYTGIHLDTNNEVELRADFDLQSLDKYKSHVSLKKDNSDLRGNVEIITPVEGYTSIIANGFLNTNRDSKRTAHLDFKQEGNVHSLDASYRIQSPILLSVNVRTPYPEFDNVGLILNHDATEGRIISQASVTYLPQKTFGASLNLVYISKIEASLIVNTPFENFEENKVNFLFDGELQDFTSHASAFIATKQASYDLTFARVNQRTNGDLTIVTPIKGYENVKASFKVRGRIHNLKGEMSLKYADQELSTEFLNKLKDNSVMINFMFNTPFTEKLRITIDHDDRNTHNGRKIHNVQLWKYGQEELNINADINHLALDDHNSVISVTSTSKGLPRDVSIKLRRKASLVDFAWVIDTETKISDEIGLFFKTNGNMENLRSLFNFTCGDKPVLEVTAVTNKESDSVIRGKIEIGGVSVPKIVSELEMVGDKTYMTAEAKQPDDANEVLLSYTFSRLQTDKLTELKTKINVKTNDKIHVTDFYFKRDLSEDLSLIMKWLNYIENKEDDVFGLEIDHKGNFEKFITSNKIHLGQFGIVSDKLEFSKDNWETISVKAEMSTPFKGYFYQSLNYNFEGQDTRMSHNLNLKCGNNEQVVTTLLMESSPHSILTFSVEEPTKRGMLLLLSATLEDGKITTKAKVLDEMDFSLLGVYSNSVYPYHPHVNLKTPFPILKDLTANLKGQLTDGSADIALSLNDHDTVQGKGVFKYEDLFNFATMLSLDSTFENFENLLLEVKNSQDQLSKKSTFTLAWAPEKKIGLSGDYIVKDLYSSSDIDRQVLLDVKLPLEKVQSVYLVAGVQFDSDKAQGQVEFDLNTDKLLDMDLNYNTADKRSVLLTVRKPEAMEYSLTQNKNDGLRESELYLNWNRNEPESNIRVKSTFKDESDSYKSDRSVSLILVHPARSIGIEHSHFQKDKSVVSAGNVFWNVDANSKLFYNFNLEDKSGRRNTFVDGSLKFGGPLRTIGLTGSVRNTQKRRISDLSLSWDLDNNKDKKIRLTTKVTGTDEVNVDVTLKLPAVQVDSKLILNKGNTLFDGSTDISYTWDNRKTLTIFSKVESNPGSYAYFSSPDRYNYSIQFGIKHPDTKLDVTFDSHLGNSKDSLTGSMGLDYLTSYRQKKNMALWLEIDKIKKQVNLLGTNPYKQFEISGVVLNEEPLRLQAVALTDQEESFKATLNVDQDIKKIRLDINNPGHDVKLTAFCPNKSAIQVDVDHKFEDGFHQEGIFSLRLDKYNTLLANLRWRPEILKEIQENVIDVFNQRPDDGRSLLSEISQDIEREIIRKHRELTAALSQGTKPLIDFIKKELNVLVRQIKILRRNLRRSENNNDLYLNDLIQTANGMVESIDINEVLNTVDSLLNRIQTKSVSVLRSLIKPLNSVPEKLEAIRNYPVSDSYRQLMATLSETLDESILALNEKLSTLQDQAVALIYSSLDNVANHPWILYVENKLQSLNELQIVPHVQGIVETVKDGLSDLGGNELSNTIQPYIDSIKDFIGQEGIHTDALEMLTETSNSVYEEMKWAYNYWAVGDNLPHLAQSSLTTLQETIKEEIKDNYRHLTQLSENPLKVYDPENGIMKVSLTLPVEINRLDEMPDVSKYVEKSSNSVQQYVSDLKEQYLPKSWTFNARDAIAVVKKNIDENSIPYKIIDDSDW